MLDTLPLELLLRILRELRLMSPLRDFISYYLISKKIHPVAQVAAFESLAISAAQFSTFINIVPFIVHRINGVLHLTLTLHNDFGMSHCPIPSSMNYKLLFENDAYDDYDCSGNCVANCYEALPRLPTQLSNSLVRLRITIEANMQMLQTFCLVVDNEPRNLRWCRCFSHPSHDLELARVIESLPLSCDNIKLDTGGCDIQKKGENQGRNDLETTGHSHLCRAIENRLKHVTHLWLRIAHLCPWFFLENHTNMSASWLSASPGALWSAQRGLVNNSNMRSIYTSYQAYAWLQLSSHEKLAWTEYFIADKASRQKPFNCPKFEKLTTLIINRCVYPVMFGSETKVSAAMAQNLCQAWHDWNCFPNLKVCNITSQHNENMSSKDMLQLQQDKGSDPSFAPFSHLFVYDCNQEKTHVLPFSFLVPETRMSNYNIKEHTYHHIHDRYGNSSYGGFNYLTKTLDQQFSSPWRQLGPDGVETTITEEALEDPVKLKTQGQWLTQAKTVAIVTEQMRHTYWLDRAEQLQNECHDGLITDIDIRNVKRNISGIGIE